MSLRLTRLMYPIQKGGTRYEYVHTRTAKQQRDFAALPYERTPPTPIPMLFPLEKWLMVDLC